MRGLPFPGQVGYPASMNADARLGFPNMGFQSAPLPFQRDGAQRNVLSRSERQATWEIGLVRRSWLTGRRWGFAFAVPSSLTWERLPPMKWGLLILGKRAECSSGQSLALGAVSAWPPIREIATTDTFQSSEHSA